MTLLGFFGPPNVENLKAARDVKGLVKALQYHQPALIDKDWEASSFAHTPQEKKQKEQYLADLAIRRHAASVLGELGDPRAVDPLIAALSDKSLAVRKAAIEALGKLGDARAFAPLTEILKDNAWEMREAAAVALGQLGDPRAIELIVQGLKLKNGNGELSRTGQTVVERLAGKLNQDSLVALLKSPDWAVRAIAAGVLGTTGSAQCVEPLIAALQDEHGKVLERAAEALGQLGDKRAVDPLIGLLQSRHEPVRLKALASLLQLGDARALDALIALAADEPNTIRAEAVSALGQFDDARVAPVLIAALNAKSDATIRQAIKALNRIGDARAVEPLARLLATGPYYWQTALDALIQLNGGDRAIEPLIAMLKRDKRLAETQKWIADKERLLTTCKDYILYLRKLGWPSTSQERAMLAVLEKNWDEVVSYGPDAVEPLNEAIQHGSQKAAETLEKLGLAKTDQQRAELAVARSSWSEAVQLGSVSIGPLMGAVRRGRAEAAAALGQLKDPTAVQPLIEALQSLSNERLMHGAIALALGAIGDPRAVAPLIGLLDKLHGSRDALEALVSIGSPAVDSLLSVLENQNRHLRVKAAVALGRIKDERAVPALSRTLTDESSEVREAAANALKELKWKATSDAERAQVAFAKRNWSKAIRLGEGRAVIEHLIGETHAEETRAKSALNDLVQLLETMANSFNIDALQSLTKLNAIGISTTLNFDAPKQFDGEVCSYPSMTVEKEIDASQVRQLARQELIRRGEHA